MNKFWKNRYFFKNYKILRADLHSLADLGLINYSRWEGVHHSRWGEAMDFSGLRPLTDWQDSYPGYPPPPYLPPPISKGYIYLNVPLIKKQNSTDKSNFFEQKHKYKQEEPHYMKSIPCIYEHEHEQRHHNYKEGSPVQPYNQNHTNEINTFSRIPFGLEK